jgi:membrane-bound lytic murein transglycosylase D
VPEILAAIIIANNPKQYGFDDITLDPPVLTDTVTLNYSVDLRLASDLVGAPVDELIALNPSLLRLVTPPDTAFDLHLPAGTATLFAQRIAGVPELKRNSWRYHRVVAEDTLASVAREYRVQVEELAAVNQLRETESIQGLEALIVPVPPSAAPSAHMTLYTARRGDTLVTIADRFGVSLSQLRRWNKITGAKVQPGQRLHVAEPVSLSRAARSHRRGTAQTGAKARQMATVKGSVQKLATPAPAKKSAIATKKSGASSAKKRQAHRPAVAPSARKSGASSAIKHPAQKSAAKPGSSSQKQK